MIKLINIRYVNSDIVTMYILIEGNIERQYRLVLDLASETLSVGRPATTVPDKYFFYIRQAWQAIQDYLAENGKLPEELSSTWC